MAAHQRTLDKTKDVIRKQLECGVASFSASGYPGDYQQEGPDYCDFVEGQKWHPYQNGANAYHSRGALMSKMNSLYRGMQSAVPHATSAWGQFCSLPFSTSQSAMMRNNRHMVFLQEQQSQHCGYQDEIQMSYEAKIQDDLARRLHSAYAQESQQPSQDSQTVLGSRFQLKSPGLQMAQLPLEEPKEGPRWSSSPRPSSVSSSSCTTDGPQELQHQHQHQNQQHQHQQSPEQQQQQQQQQHQQQQQQQQQQQRSQRQQPLPGFQQAFGSTEIGRFSRSELFASLVEAANVSSSSNAADRLEGDSPSPSPDLADPAQPNYGPTPRWHSPYVGAIGSEI